MYTEQPCPQPVRQVPPRGDLNRTVLMDPSETANRYDVIRRNGTLTRFDAAKIKAAMTKAFLAVEGGKAAASRRIHETVEQLTREASEALFRRLPDGGSVHIEDIQDQVELALMRNGHQKVARAYVLYREERTRLRNAESESDSDATVQSEIQVTQEDGSKVALDRMLLHSVVSDACRDLDDVSAEQVLTETLRNLYDGISATDVSAIMTLSARMLIEQEPNYSYVAARLLLNTLHAEVLGGLGYPQTSRLDAELGEIYPAVFLDGIHRAIELELLDPALGRFDLARLARRSSRNGTGSLAILGLQTLYDRYFMHRTGAAWSCRRCFSCGWPWVWPSGRTDRERRAIEFYDLLSSFDYMASTPTLFNSGTLRPQLSSCYLTTVPDDLEGIYGAIQDNAMLSKWAGGLGNDWTPVRALGAHIKGTNGKSQGVVPFLKVVNDTAVAVNQGGKRKGAVCAYLESWHLDIEEFLELRKNTGDERRRTHDMNTANWVPDLLMRARRGRRDWTLFSPGEVPDLHDLYGRPSVNATKPMRPWPTAAKSRSGKPLPAKQLWRKMLTVSCSRPATPGSPSRTPATCARPQQHLGVVHTSNLCTEITLNTSDEEIAVCNLGSVNLAAHVGERRAGCGAAGAHRVDGGAHARQRHRHQLLRRAPGARFEPASSPGGPGTDGLPGRPVPARCSLCSSEAAVEFADRSMEQISLFCNPGLDRPGGRTQALREL